MILGAIESTVGFVQVNATVTTRMREWLADTAAEELRLKRADLGEDHERTLLVTDEVGQLLMALGRLAEAEPLLLENLKRCERVLGADHKRTINSANQAAGILRELGR